MRDDAGLWMWFVVALGRSGVGFGPRAVCTLGGFGLHPAGLAGDSKGSESSRTSSGSHGDDDVDG